LIQIKRPQAGTVPDPAIRPTLPLPPADP
jgi:hypothetical protein